MKLTIDIMERVVSANNTLSFELQAQADSPSLEIANISLVRDVFAAGLHIRQGASIQEIPTSGVISVPDSGALRFALRARTIWHEAASREILDFGTELEEIQVLVRAERGASGSGMGGLEPGSVRCCLYEVTRHHRADLHSGDKTSSAYGVSPPRH